MAISRHGLDFITTTPAPQGRRDYRAVYEHIASVRPLLFATAEDGHREMKLCEAVLKSSRNKG